MNPQPDAAPSTGSDTRGTSVIENTIAVLRCFSSASPLLGVTEIAPVVGLHKSTVSRILAALERENVVERDSSRRYRLGLGIIALAGPLLADMDVRRAAYPVLQELSETTGETSALLVWNGAEAISVEQVPSRFEVKHTSDLGTRYNTASSSSVQVFLAAEGEQRTRELLQDHTVNNVPGGDDQLDAYLERLHEVSRRGYAVNFGETSPQEVGIAAPVQDHRGATVAAVMTPAPKFRIEEDNVKTIGEACVRAARQVTQRLGGT
ncbi:IclR family transcriptional regulator [Arthrobacter castelli]|uniref:IclR family transcriptional regulator n=1 Tax=Arthrobacter castelli TaxID=271431 RepID=UPI00047D0961|nr:IclR family transcriptional regulator [Arthrobacter castelli]